MAVTSTWLKELQIAVVSQGVNTEALPDRLLEGEVLKTTNLVGRRNHLVQVDGFTRRGSNLGFDLNGTSHYFNITHGAQTNIHQTGSVTVSALFKTNSSYTGNHTIIARWTGSTATNQYRLRVDSTGDVVWEVSDGSGTELIRTGTALTTSTVYVASASWHATNGLILRVWTALETLQETVTGSTSLSALNSSTTPDTTIGAKHGGGDYYAGVISYVRYKDVEDNTTTIPDFRLDNDTQGQWRGALNAVPKLIDYSEPDGTQNSNDMTVHSITATQYSNVCGTVVPQLYGEPQHIDIYGVAADPLVLVTTSLRHYQWSPTLLSWQDATGSTNLANVLEQKAQGGNFFDGTDGSVYVVTNHNDAPKVRKTATDELSNLSTSLTASFTARIFRGFGAYGNFYNCSISGTDYIARHQWSSPTEIGNGDWDIGATGDWTDLVDTPGQIMQALQLGNQMFIYKERGAIIAQTLSGRAAPTWQYQTLYAGSSGILAANTLRNIGGRRQMFLGVGDIMMFDGRDIAGTSEKVFNQISDLVDVVDIHKSWAFWDEQRQDYQLWFPAGGTSNPARCWTYNVPKKAWYGPTEPNTTQGKYVLGEYSQELDILIWSDQSSSWDSSAITWDAEQVSEQTPYLFTTSGMVYRVTGTSNLFDAGAIDTRLDFSELFFYEKQDPNAYRPPTGSRVLARWEEVEIEAAVGSGATLTLQYSTDEGNNFTSIGSPVSTTYDSTLRRYVWYPDFVADKVRWRLDKTGAGTSIRIAGARFAGQPIERR